MSSVVGAGDWKAASVNAPTRRAAVVPARVAAASVGATKKVEFETCGFETCGFETCGLDTCGLDTCGFETCGLDTCGFDTCGLEMRGVVFDGLSGLKMRGEWRSLVKSVTASCGLLRSPLNRTVAVSPPGTIVPPCAVISATVTANACDEVMLCAVANTFCVAVDSGNTSTSSTF